MGCRPGTMFFACAILFLVVGCRQQDEGALPDWREIEGAWDVAGPSSLMMHFGENGVWHYAHTPAELGAVVKNEPSGFYELQDSRLVFSDVTICGETGDGIYELSTLENGDPKFSLIEDNCFARVNFLQGPTQNVIWTRFAMQDE